MLEEQYSGENSKAFWEIVNLVDDEDSLYLYELGCKLQNLESDVLKKINARYLLIRDLKNARDKLNKRKGRKRG
jgi:ribosomal 50S subunit-associated protein YjgA (DUF615 family)